MLKHAIPILSNIFPQETIYQHVSEVVSKIKELTTFHLNQKKM